MSAAFNSLLMSMRGLRSKVKWTCALNDTSVPAEPGGHGAVVPPAAIGQAVGHADDNGGRGRGPAGGVSRTVPVVCGDCGPGRPAGAGVHAARRAGPRLPRLHGRRPLRRVPGPPARRAAAGQRVRQPAFLEPDVGEGVGAGRAVPGAHPLLLQRLAGRLRGRVHREREQGPEARRRVVPVRSRADLSPDLRQSQLGQRHPRVRARAGRPHRLRAGAAARPARRRRRGDLGALRHPARPAEPVRLPGAVELLGRAAPARVDRAGAATGLGRAARRGSLRSGEPAGSPRGAAGLRRPLVLQDVRLPHRRRRAAGSPAGPRKAPAPVVRGRDDHGGLREGGPPLPGARGRGLRGGDADLPDHSRRGHRPSAHGVGRHRRHPRPRGLPDRLAASRRSRG